MERSSQTDPFIENMKWKHNIDFETGVSNSDGIDSLNLCFFRHWSTIISKYSLCSFRVSATLLKKPGSIQGQPFDIINCKNCEILVLDNCDQVQIDEVSDSKIFIGASSESIFVRNCKNCSFTVACKQLRTRDCSNCTFNLYCKTDPIIETSTQMRFAPFNGAYLGHYKAMIDADLDPCNNRWHEVYDFNDPSKTRKNWSYVKREEEEPLWCPLGTTECCVPRFTHTIQSLVSSPSSHEQGRLSESEQILGLSSDACHRNDQTRNNFGGKPSQDYSGSLNKLISFGRWAWGVISQSISSVRAFCVTLFFDGMRRTRNIISFGFFRGGKQER